MPTIVNELVLEEFVALQRRAIRTNLIVAMIVASLGIAFILYFLSAWSPVKSDMKTISTLGGVFVSSLSGFRINEILQRKERIKVIRLFQDKLRSVDHDKLSRAEQKRLEEVLWRIAEKSITG
jgi:hypothetical protein